MKRDEPCPAAYVWQDAVAHCAYQADGHRNHWSDDLTFPVSWTTPALTGATS